MTNGATNRAGRHGRPVIGMAAAIAVLALVAVGCSTSGKKTAATTTTTSTTAAGPGTTGGTTSAPPTSPPPKTTSTTAAPNTDTTWAQNATKYRGKNGTTYTIDCAPNGTKGVVWGAGVYTDDSSICTAATQSGLITTTKGGSVTYKIAASAASYEAGSAHGVTSSSYGSWSGSFTFPAAPPGTVKTVSDPESWSRNVTQYRGMNGKKVAVDCSANGTLAGVWGSGPFTDDSSVCSAAVYAGQITVAKGGTVIAVIAPGESSYKGKTAHGVTTSDYGSWSGSFTLAPPTPH